MDQIPHSASLRLLVIRLSAMGDVAMVAPVLAALRKNYPNIQISMLTPKFLQPFFREVGEMSFFSPDLKNRHKGIRGLLRLGHDIGRFDMVADLHDVLRSKGLCKLLRWKGARVERIDKGRAEKKALTAPKDKIKVQLKTTVERYRDVFVRLGFDLPAVPLPQRIHYPMSPETLALAGERSRFWIGVSPFAQHEGKIYPPEKMREVILRLADIPDSRIFIFGGGASEKQFAEETAALKENIVSVIGRIKLGQEMELISNLDLMVLRSAHVVVGRTAGYFDLGSYASFCGVLRIRTGSGSGRTDRPRVPPLLGLRKQALPHGRLPLHDRHHSGKSSQESMRLPAGSSSPGE